MNKVQTSPSNKENEVAAEVDVSDRDLPLLEGITGRSDDLGAEPGSIAADDIQQPVGAQPKSEITGHHDEGSDANETEDGLDETEEMTRKAAEETPEGRREEDLPVFDRGDTLPRV